MAILLGKRKRAVAPEVVQNVKVQPSAPSKRRRESEQSSDDEAARARFRKAFEKKFKPLEVEQKVRMSKNDELSEGSEDDEGSDEEGSDLEEDDWSGIEDEEEDEDEVEIVQHVLPEFTRGAESDPGKKKFMSSKPPTLESTTTSKPLSKPRKQDLLDDDDAESSLEAANLKNDLALQRLLSESHLLQPSTTSSTTPTGKSRLQALDLRLQSLGAKTSLLKQTNMPLAHRKGIVEKGVRREGERRKEARENGVVLEREKRERRKDGRRERGVGALPGVGRMRGGTLRLSEGDVRSIEGRRTGSGKKGGKRRGR